MLDPSELLIEHWPPRKDRGGQHVGLEPGGVRVTHLPTNTVACVEISRSQHRNRMIAVEMIEFALTHPQFR